MSEMPRERPRDIPEGTTSTTESARGRATSVRHEADMTSHPDVHEMGERYARVLQGPRASAVDGLIMITGVYTAISGWVIHFQTTNSIMAVNNLIIGGALAVLGLGMAVLPERLLPLGWVASAMGVWLIISPWVASVAHSAPRPLVWNNVVAGACAFVFGLAAMGLLRASGVTRRSRA
jgi:hypothetical protein